MIWYLAQPFMGEYFALRSRMLLYEYVMGTSDILKGRIGHEAKMQRQEQNFLKLQAAEQQRLKNDYRELQIYAKRPALKKIEDGLYRLTHHIPPFEQAWIFFSVTIAILILLKIEGAKQAAWILPLIVVAYAIDNQLTGTYPSTSPDDVLFPAEEFIIQKYLDQPLASAPLEQKKQLETGWKNYLIDNWSSELRTNEKEQLENAEYRFTLARLNLLHNQSRSEWLHIFHEKLGPLSLVFYLSWNILFAWICSRRPLDDIR
jgi:hypothetical protein